MDIYFHFPAEFDENKEVFNDFIDIMKYKRTYNKGLNILYCPSNLDSFKRFNENYTYFTSEISIIRSFANRGLIKEIDIKSENILYNQYISSIPKVEPCINILKAIAQKVYALPTYKSLVVNFMDGIETCRNKILVFRDSDYLGYPDHFIRIDEVKNYIELNEWLKTNNVTNFSLRDQSKFRKVSSIIVKGATVYLEMKTNYYWHLDTFHKYIEYEVYNSQGIHMATANENGQLDTDRKDSTKTINIE